MIFNGFCACSNSFHQKFWMPSIPAAFHFFHLVISFFIFLSVMANSLMRFALLPSSVFTSSIHGIFGVGSICSQMPPQKLNKTLHLGHFTFALFHRFQSLKKTFLVSLEHDVMFLPIAFFNTFLQLHLQVFR